jgi:hypothetical protein
MIVVWGGSFVIAIFWMLFFRATGIGRSIDLSSTFLWHSFFAFSSKQIFMANNNSHGGQQGNQEGQQGSTKGGQGGQGSLSKNTGSQPDEQLTGSQKEQQEENQHEQGNRGGNQGERQGG